MTLFLMDVMDLKVFDEKGKFITKLDKATKGKLVHSVVGESYFGINCLNLDIELIKALGEVVDKANVSDFEKELTPTSTKIKFKSAPSIKNDKRFKLIAEGCLRNEDNEISQEFKVIINDSILTTGLELEGSNTEIGQFTHIFDIQMDENGDCFELELFDK